MATIRRFEDIEAWKTARRLTQRVYAVSKRGGFRRDFVLCDQTRRASISITSNTAEDFERDGTREFISFLSISFLSIAKGSAGEVRNRLYVALDEGYITSDTFDELSALAVKVSRKVGALMRYLQKSSLPGQGYR